LNTCRTDLPDYPDRDYPPQRSLLSETSKTSGCFTVLSLRIGQVLDIPKGWRMEDYGKPKTNFFLMKDGGMSTHHKKRVAGALNPKIPSVFLPIEKVV